MHRERESETRSSEAFLFCFAFFFLIFSGRCGGILTPRDDDGGGRGSTRKKVLRLVLHEHPVLFINDGLCSRVQTAIDDWLDGWKR